MKNQISQGASVPGVQSPTNGSATGCDATVRDPCIEETLAAWERLAEAAYRGPWQGVRLDLSALEGCPAEATEKERMKAYTAGSIDLGGDEFYAVLCEKPDGLADVCHTGNGPTSAANCLFLAAARDAVPALIAEVRSLRAALLAATGHGVEEDPLDPASVGSRTHPSQPASEAVNATVPCGAEALAKSKASELSADDSYDPDDGRV